MGRPLGVTILGAGMILAGLGFAAGAVLIFFVGSTGATAAAPQSGAMAAALAAFGAAGGIIFLLTIFLFLLIAAGACLGLVATLLSYSHAGLLWNGSILVLDLLALWYLLRPATKEAFHA
jgi:hypothetical protein